MLLDKNAILSEDQAVTSTAASTNTIDNKAAGNAVPGGLFVVVRATEAFAGATKVVIDIQTAAASNFSSASTLISQTYLAADLAAPKTLFVAAMPAGMKRYVRAYYTVTGTGTAGKLTCFLTDGVNQA